MSPKDYQDVKDIISETIFSYEADSIVEVLSFSSSIGPIIPPEHIKELQIKEALDSLSNEFDESLLEEIHNTLNVYVERKIRIFNSIVEKFIEDSNYELEMTFDQKYLWCERFYLEMFGIWTPRMIIIHFLKDDEGKPINFHESNFEKYCYCPMKKNEISQNECFNCPFLNSDFQTLKCKYKIGIEL